MIFRRCVFATLVAVLLVGISLPSSADAPYYLEVSPTSAGDLSRLLDALETSFDEQLLGNDTVVVVLHGEEARSFTRQSYAENRSLVDRAALLHAHQVLELRMCETWMRRNGVQPMDLLPFVDTVPYAPEEIRRLQDEGASLHPSVAL